MNEQPDLGPFYVPGEPPRAYVRAHAIHGHQMRIYGPKSADHPSVGRPCAACGQPFVAGDLTTLIGLGPGDDPEARAAAREGRYFNCVAAELHAACSVVTD